MLDELKRDHERSARENAQASYVVVYILLIALLLIAGFFALMMAPRCVPGSDGIEVGGILVKGCPRGR